MVLATDRQEVKSGDFQPCSSERGRNALEGVSLQSNLPNQQFATVSRPFVHGEKKGGFFENILRENLQLRKINKDETPVCKTSP